MQGLEQWGHLAICKVYVEQRHIESRVGPEEATRLGYGCRRGSDLPASLFHHVADRLDHQRIVFHQQDAPSIQHKTTSSARCKFKRPGKVPVKNSVRGNWRTRGASGPTPKVGREPVPSRGGLDKLIRLLALAETRHASACLAPPERSASGISRRRRGTCVEARSSRRVNSGQRAAT